MGEAVSWLVEVAVKPGELENFRALMEEMVESTRAEPGAVSYEWFVSDDGSVVQIYERYADSAAVLAHGATFGEKFAGRWVVAVDPIRCTVFGTPTEEAKAALSPLRPTYLRPFGGFVR